MSDKYFPICTTTSCQLKWNWSTIRLFNGATSSCHRVNSDTITSDNFNFFHNTPKKLADRQLMLEGKWPTGGCEYCKNIEESGGSSDRMMHLTIPNLTPKELDNNPIATTVTPKILEIYFDNVCNMSCIYCWNGFSSKIEQENVKFGPFSKHGVEICNSESKSAQFKELGEALWAWMETNAHELVRFHVLGGEPFYQEQFDRCLNFFDTNPCPNLEFNVVSNLMIAPKKLQIIIDRIKQLLVQRKLKRFDLTCSIDSFGAEQEYVRYGLDLNQWRENFEYVAGQKWIYLNFNQVLSGLTIKQVAPLLKYINNLRKHRDIYQYFSTPVFTQDSLHPEIFGPGYFDTDFDEILKNMPVSTDQQKQMYKYMEGIQAQVNSKPRNQAAINRLGVFLDEIDRRRNLDWRTTFPWLVKEIENVV